MNISKIFFALGIWYLERVSVLCYEYEFHSISSQLAYNEADLKRDQELKEGLVTSALFYFSGLRKEFTKFFYYMLKYMCNFLCK